MQNFELLIAHNIASLHKNLPLTAALFDLYNNPGFPRLVLWHHDLAWTTPRYKHEVYDGYPWDLLRSPWEGAVHVVISEIRRNELARTSPNSRPIDPCYTKRGGYKILPQTGITQTIQLVDQLKLIHADPLLLLPVRLTPRKNIELALHVLAGLRQVFPNAMLLVTGPEGAHNPSNRTYKTALFAFA